jgi:hypothetical protein
MGLVQTLGGLMGVRSLTTDCNTDVNLDPINPDISSPEKNPKASFI